MKCQHCKLKLDNPHPNRRYCNLTCRNRALRKRNPGQDIAVEAARKRRALRTGLVLPPETELTYYNYKEPLREVENGHGYMGVIAGNKEGSHVQCHVCGYFFAFLPGHIGTHNLNASQYKERFGLLQKSALVSENRRQEMVASYQMRNDEAKNGLKNRFLEINKLRKQEKYAGRKVRTRWALERRNLEGNCPDQLLDKIKQVAERLGHAPSAKEFRTEHTAYATAIINTFGTWNRAIKMAGLVSEHENKKAQYRLNTSREKLLAYLREFYKTHRRVPTNSDFSRGLLPYKKAYYDEFGSMIEARYQAGLPALVQVSAGIWAETYDNLELSK